MSPERGAPAPYFCRGALIRLEDGSLRRVEEMRTEDFVMSADRSGDLALTQCTLLRLEERGDKLSLTLTYDRNRSQVRSFFRFFRRVESADKSEDCLDAVHLDVTERKVQPALADHVTYNLIRNGS